MDSPIALPKNVDVAQVAFGNLKTLDNGGKTVYLSHKGNPLIIQTPQMSVPFGSSRWNPAGANAPSTDPSKDKHSVELSFKGHEINASLAAFQRLLSELDDKIVEGGLDNSSAWFKKKYNSKDVVAALYTPMLKRSKNKETGEPDDRYPPTIRLSLPFADGKYKVDVFGRDKQPIELSAIEKGSKVTAILQCVGLWVAGGKFGCTWKVVQLWVIPPEAIRGFAFRDDGSGCASDLVSLPPATAMTTSEDEEAILDAAAAETGSNPDLPATELVADSEDEDSEDDPIEQKPIKRVQSQPRS